MNKIEREKLTIQLIGEAAFTLLLEKGPINKQSLIRQLQLMGSSVVDGKRGEFIAGLIAELSSDHSSFFQTHGTQKSVDRNTDNVYPIFGGNTASSDSRKH